MICAFTYTFISAEDKQKYNHDMNDYETNSIWGKIYFRLIVMIVASIIVYSLMFMKNIQSLRFTTTAGIVAIVIVLLVIIIQLPSFMINYYNNIYDPNKPDTHINWYDPSKGFDSKFLAVKGLSTIFLAFNVHSNIFLVYEKLYNNTNKRIKKVVRRSVILDGVIYLIFGACGFLTQPYDVPPIILSRNPLPGSLDIFMCGCRFLIAFVITCKIPVLFNAFRIFFVNLIWNDVNISTIQNIVITSIVAFSTVTIGVFYNDIMNIVSFLGGFCGVIISVTMPALIQLKIYKDKPFFYYKKLGVIVILGLISLIGYWSAVLSLIEFFN